MVYMRTPEKEKDYLVLRRAKMKETEPKKKRKQENETKNEHARRTPAESRGDKVAVCWYDQSY